MTTVKTRKTKKRRPGRPPEIPNCVMPKRSLQPGALQEPQAGGDVERGGRCNAEVVFRLQRSLADA